MYGARNPRLELCVSSAIVEDIEIRFIFDFDKKTFTVRARFTAMVERQLKRGAAAVERARRFHALSSRELALGG